MSTYLTGLVLEGETAASLLFSYHLSTTRGSQPQVWERCLLQPDPMDLVLDSFQLPDRRQDKLLHKLLSWCLQPDGDNTGSFGVGQNLPDTWKNSKVACLFGRPALALLTFQLRVGPRRTTPHTCLLTAHWPEATAAAFPPWLGPLWHRRIGEHWNREYPHLMLNLCYVLLPITLRWSFLRFLLLLGVF